ncbi:MAG: hypothetical protein NWF00_11170 [Candidatus Bathyarchaeota archaeon]|nr:hypothetical protein [Candidatus Bathyarchaeota archaeon]
MNRKIVSATLALAVLLCSFAAGMHSIGVAEANFFPGDALLIYSPTYQTVYTNTSVPFHVAASVANPRPEVECIIYSLDENTNVTLTDLNKTLRIRGHIDGSQFSAELVLENLAKGNHTLKVYSLDTVGTEMSASVEFFVDTTYTSPLSVLSPQNTTYTTTEVPLTYVCRETHELDGNFGSAAYILDGIGSNNIYENVTLTDLSVSNHTIHVTVWTDNYQFFTKTIHFTISNQTPTPSPASPTNSPTQQPTTEPTASPEVPEFPVGAILALLLASAVSIPISYMKRRNKKE